MEAKLKNLRKAQEEYDSEYSEWVSELRETSLKQILRRTPPNAIQTPTLTKQTLATSEKTIRGILISKLPFHLRLIPIHRCP
jgi:hypothetical protein